jgi:hypothetical protein
LVHLTVHGSACAWTWIRANVVRGLIIICVWLWCSFSGDLAGDIFLRHPTPHTDAHTQLQACTHDGGGKGGVRGAVARKTPTIALRTLAPFSRRASSQPAQRRRASRALCRANERRRMRRGRLRCVGLLRHLGGQVHLRARTRRRQLRTADVWQLPARSPSARRRGRRWAAARGQTHRVTALPARRRRCAVRPSSLAACRCPMPAVH